MNEPVSREVGSMEQLGDAPEARYCYSLDEEEYYGDFASRDDALAEATAELDGYGEPGETHTVWTGIQRHAMHFLRRSAAHIGEDFAERIDEWLGDDIAADDAIVEIDDAAAFGAELLTLLEKHARFTRWAVVDVQEHEAVVPGEPAAPNAELSGPGRRC